MMAGMMMMSLIRLWDYIREKAWPCAVNNNIILLYFSLQAEIKYKKFGSYIIFFLLTSDN
jgi:hypothetical protein